MDLILGNIFDYMAEAEVIAQGCNCFCTQGAGIAREFVDRFRTDKLPMEDPKWRGHYNKLGTIDYGAWDRISHTWGESLGKPGSIKPFADSLTSEEEQDYLYVVNAYTQYQPGKDAKYWALESCIWKICQRFAGQKIYIPMIGSGIGGLDPDATLKIFEQYPITVVQYDPT